MKTLALSIKNHFKLLSHQGGSTLVELLLYMGLLSIFLLTLTDIFVAILEVRTDSAATSAVVEDGRYLLARLNYDISQATTISTPANGGDNSPTLVLVIGGTNYTYSLSSNNLVLTNNFGSNNLNSSETRLPSLNFQKLTNGTGSETVKINFTIASVTTRKKGEESRSFQTTVGKR